MADVIKSGNVIFLKVNKARCALFSVKQGPERGEQVTPDMGNIFLVEVKKKLYVIKSVTQKDMAFTESLYK